MEIKTMVNRVKHKTCNKIFSEIKDQELATCPWCKRPIHDSDDVELISAKQVKVNPIQGIMYYVVNPIESKGDVSDGTTTSNDNTTVN